LDDEKYSLLALSYFMTPVVSRAAGGFWWMERMQRDDLKPVEFLPGPFLEQPGHYDLTVFIAGKRIRRKETSTQWLGICYGYGWTDSKYFGAVLS
jgi:hypothetical protein